MEMKRFHPRPGYQGDTLLLTTSLGCKHSRDTFLVPTAMFFDTLQANTVDNSPLSVLEQGMKSFYPRDRRDGVRP